jgi:primosomal protein N' (replication factor Y)
MSTQDTKGIMPTSLFANLFELTMRRRQAKNNIALSHMPSNTKPNYQGTVLQIAVPSPLRKLFDYLPAKSQEALPGMRVRVPFGRQKLVGIVIATSNNSELKKNKLKPILSVLDTEPLLSDSVFQLLIWAAGYYQHPLGEVFATALPGKLRTGNPLRQQIEYWSCKEPIKEEEKISLERAKKQKALLEFIHSKKEVTRDECLQAGYNAQLLRELSKKELIQANLKAKSSSQPFSALIKSPELKINLNSEQKNAVKTITKSLTSYCCFLLDGITGSGKTEVYMRLMQEQLAKGLQCLVLVPEIGLTPQTISRFEERFTCPIVSLHSGLNETERLSAWTQARDGSAAIVIGTRSAVFTPLAKPGLIIIDEEHDTSFKQQDGFRYSARDLAVIRAREEKVCIVLGSATPSLESLHNAQRGKFTHLKLSQRTGVEQAASMEVVDTSNASLLEGFSEQLLYKIEKHLEQKNQVLVFINRRGFAPILNCQTCGWVCECEHCMTQFTVHSNPASIRCHHCGTSAQLPRHCLDCKSKDLNTIGIGTQRAESFLKKRFDHTPIIRIDRDSTRRKNSLASMLEKINDGEPCILLGTQMLAKGHHFPNITLVAILDADAGLFSADFRGQEHMGQTIIQVAGRAGRAQRAGEVLIQSRHGSHETLQSLCKNSYAEFSHLQLQERLNALMPPFSHLCLLRAEAKEMKAALTLLDQIAHFIDRFCQSNSHPIEKLGPMPAPMEKRAGKYRVQLLLKSIKRGNLQALLSQLCVELETMKYPRSVRFSIDVDPQDLI